MKSGGLCERDVPGWLVPEVNPAGFTQSAAQSWRGWNFSVSVSSKHHSPVWLLGTSRFV